MEKTADTHGEQRTQLCYFVVTGYSSLETPDAQVWKRCGAMILESTDVFRIGRTHALLSILYAEMATDIQLLPVHAHFYGKNASYSHITLMR